VKMFALACVVEVVVLAAKSQVASAGLIIFDDDYGSGWARSARDMYADTDITHSGSAASLRRIGGVTVGVTHRDGLDISGTPLLQAYVNFLVSEATPGHAFTNVKVRTTSGMLFEFDDRSEGWVCYLDGLEYRDAAAIVFDTDPHTWQLFEIDLSQTDYFGWPYEARQLGSTPITGIEFSAYGNTIGTIDMLADDIWLVPEPATTTLLGAGIMGLLLCRGRAGYQGC